MNEVAAQCVQWAQDLGAQEAAASAHRVREVEVQWRDGQLEKIVEATTRGVAVELYVDGRYASVSSSDVRPEALKAFLAEAVAMTRTLAPDPFRSLADPSLYPDWAREGRAPSTDLDLVDQHHGELTAVRRRELAGELEAAARSVPGADRILSVTTGVSDDFTESWRVHSNGFAAHRLGTSFWLSAEVSVQDPDGRRPEDGAHAGSRFAAELPTARSVGELAASRTLGRIGAAKPASAVLPMVIEPRAAGRMVSLLLGPASAAALQQKRSFLGDKLGTRIGSRLLHLIDDPLVPRGFGSRLYDGDGIAARPMVLLNDGVLEHLYVDLYYGRKLGMAPTTGRASNLLWRLGDRDCTGLCAEVGDGILVTGFLGGNSNSTTGDFSLGVQGQRIRGGVLAEPLAEANIAGNQLQLWQQLAAVGNDPYAYSTMRTPTLVFEGIQFAGT
jgi:PmbA protein